MVMPQGLPSVLLVEREYRLRLQYKSLFKKYGLELAGEAEEVSKACDLARESRPGVVLCRLAEGQEESLARLAKLAPVLLMGSLPSGLGARLPRLGIYGYLPEGTGEEELLASLSIVACRWQEKQELRQEAEELRDLLALRKILDQAKGILMKKHHMSEQEAHRRIQRYAMYKRLTVKSVAEAIIKATGGKG